ncbi:class I SAM-dependent methyltransferase [Shewanella sp. 3_MG-2023]|uniref:class I SAM-dependent methyltransferase n=1 Tax=Shewanella sp. 3_MG-2023 TaxID=3062635 RepID=UPI0026E1D30C|nr:class I SAM-dependent methyltransferase [Shewanella sp. 3_MG-2023]MDO6776733.1 class I SAM-dependent methyltransferase [Shewanella sp. 3_MG-2023]
MQDYVSINKLAWNERAKVHFDSSFYDVAGFLKGKSSLTEIETAELTDVSGKSLLHLQCHFGLDSLSWVRKGAIVTAVDLSDVAIAKANALALQCELKAEFICADVYQFGDQSLPQFTGKKVTDFDIVFTSYGTICWLPCLDRWANIIAKSLKQGGCFYMAEFHPLQDVLEGYSYFHKTEADVVVEGSYTESHGNFESASSPQSTTSTPQTMLTWPHSLSDVINALIKAGIRIDSLNEYPFSPYNCFENLIEQAPNQFHSIVKGNSVPLVFTVKGTKV